MFIQSVLICIFVNTFRCVIAVQPDIMYSFGPNSSDISLPKNDDGSYGPIRLNFKLRFFDKIYSKVYVSTNGLISFLSPINKKYLLNNYTSTPLFHIQIIKNIKE